MSTLYTCVQHLYTCVQQLQLPHHHWCVKAFRSSCYSAAVISKIILSQVQATAPVAMDRRGPSRAEIVHTNCQITVRACKRLTAILLVRRHSPGNPSHAHNMKHMLQCLHRAGIPLSRPLDNASKSFWVRRLEVSTERCSLEGFSHDFGLCMGCTAQKANFKRISCYAESTQTIFGRDNQEKALNPGKWRLP